MRKLVDTVVLVFLLIGPAVVLTCVRQPDEMAATVSETQMVEEEEEEIPSTILVYNEMPRP